LRVGGAGARRRLRAKSLDAKHAGSLAKCYFCRATVMIDPVQALVHDHAELNRRVFAVGSAIRALDCEDGNGLAVALASRLDELREMMFLHFAREEEGLFPFVAELVPGLAEQVHGMALAHDAICGGLARMCHLATANAEPTLITAVFDRFEAAYASHAEVEAELLRALSAQLGPGDRERLAELVRGL
jgi:iron-sulfur cluster repair protein YtfE (RIC family)